ncbi:MAG TPA: 1-acyl-sn-glycerol-3-phosphate acyltransferase [Leptolyngbyaceae cyanobacterium M33_DOE_097]|uniref:Glycerol acyltransferase n=1 Tax=Oscillatoriales cyanobacterium SpSt-418 TaxID=2282169 RepID=A0A7C3PFM0_9CYAN|nr:1-acyl-sn-glycerol-3-phosphate acyltransferase [Leptolyngbyaceae cyanobacterium M33_DOE_097]
MSIASQPYRLTRFDRFCLWYPPAWLILFNRHWQHYKPDPDGWNGLEYFLFLLPGGFYLAMGLRWLRLGGRSPHMAQSEYDPDYQQALRQEILTPIVQRYFRGTLENAEILPQKGPLIIAMNHAGMSFPWDLTGIGILLSQHISGSIQPLAHTMFFDHPWLTWWLPPGWMQVVGGVRAEPQEFEQAIAANMILLYAPEGIRGISKGWQQRYQLATFDPSFVRLSIRHKVPILPVVCVGNEGLHPWALNLTKIARWFRLPMFPVSPLILVFALFPSMGVWAMRTQLRYYVQPQWQPWKDITTNLSHRLTYEQAESLRSQMQQILNQLCKPKPRG